MPAAPLSPLHGTDRLVIDGTNLLYRLGSGTAAPPAAIIGRLRAAVPPAITIDLVFDGIGLFGIWFLLVTRQHSRLARHFVRLPGAPVRSEEEVVALFRRRLAPIREWTPPVDVRAPLARAASAG